MNIIIRAYNSGDIPSIINVWNEVVEEGNAFPQEEYLTEDTAKVFFAEQTCCAVAEEPENHKIYGLYILHPNNTGRCSHICNAGFAVRRESRGLHIGEKLVKHYIVRAKEYGFKYCNSMR